MKGQISSNSSKQILEYLLHCMPVGLVVIDCNTNTPILINERAQGILKISTPEELDEFLVNYGIPTCSEIPEYKKEIRLPDGNDQRIIGMTIYNNNFADITLSFIFLKDISELRKQEEKLRKSFESEFSRRIAASIAHEIGNPLSALKVSLKLILDNIDLYDKNKIKNLLTSMVEEVDKVDRFLKDFLAYARTRHMEIEAEDFCSLLDDVLAFMKNSFDSNNITLVNKCCRDSTSYKVRVDGKRLKQVLINIFKNSIEAIIAKGFILISCSVVSYNEHKMLKVEIADTGVGIKKDILPRVFSPFFTTKVYGSGLGLSLAREMIEKMGGNISINSVEGEGTTVTILLPLEEAMDIE